MVSFLTAVILSKKNRVRFRMCGPKFQASTIRPDPSENGEAESLIGRPKSRMKKTLRSLEDAQRAINGNIDNKLTDVEKERLLAEEARKNQPKSESNAEKPKKKILDVWQKPAEETKPPLKPALKKSSLKTEPSKPDTKLDRIQSWVNQIEDDKSSSSGRDSAQSGLLKKTEKKQNGSIPPKGPPKVKQKES